MPSIFIWKSPQPNQSQKTITYFSGSDWFLEEHDSNSHSFSFIDQVSIILENSVDSALVYHAKKMPYNWVGSDILEIMTVPYQLVKSDSFGTLEQIGDWMRFTSANETTSFDSSELIMEMKHVNEWMNVCYVPPSHTPQKKDDVFLIKFNISQNQHYNINTTKNKHACNKSYHKRTQVQIPIVAPLT